MSAAVKKSRTGLGVDFSLSHGDLRGFGLEPGGKFPLPLGSLLGTTQNSKACQQKRYYPKESVVVLLLERIQYQRYDFRCR